MKINDKVATPNGPGVIDGRTPEGKIIVRHKIKEMTGNDAGKCTTPRAVIVALYEYDEKDII